MYAISKKLFISAVLFLGFFSWLGITTHHAAAQEAATPECKVTNATFNPYTPKDTYKENFYKEANPPQVTITITTTNCQNKEVHVSLFLDEVGGDDSEIITNRKGKQIIPGNFTVPETNSFTITLISGEESCNQDSGDGDCEYYIVAKPAGSTSSELAYESLGQQYGSLNYDCDAFCNTPWRFSSDTSLKPQTEVPLENGGGLADPNSKCINQTDCYELYGGLAEALGNKITILTTSSDSSIGGLFNMLIGFVTGIAGILLVGRIFYLGFLYMQNKKDGNPVKLGDVKSQIFKAVIGFLLLLCIYTILRTINPDLLVLVPRFGEVTLEQIPTRTEDPEFIQNTESLDTVGISANIQDFTDATFLMYLYHQQGPGGAPSILWAAKNGLTTVPNKTPFIKGNASRINTNMANNVNISDMQKVLGTSTLTPANFLRYWRAKVEVAKRKGGSIDSGIKTVIDTVSQETGVPSLTLAALCVIESGCTPRNISVVNKFGFSGLFQLSRSVFRDYGKGGNILEAYPNAYAAARYALDNLRTFERQKVKLGN